MCGALLVALDESFIAFVIAYLRRDDGTSAALATAIAAMFVIGGLVAAARLSRTAHDEHATRRRDFGGALRAAAATMVIGAVGSRPSRHPA